jgi:hypothetical protein
MNGKIIRRTCSDLRFQARAALRFQLLHPELAVRVLRQRRSLPATEVFALRVRTLFSDPPPELLDPQAVTML